MEYMGFIKAMGREKNTRPIGLVKNEILWGSRYDVFNIIYIIMIIKKINSQPQKPTKIFSPTPGSTSAPFQPFGLVP